MAETQKQLLMRKLNCTEEEAEDIIKTDKIIDKGGRTEYDLTPEEEKKAAKFAHTGERKKKPLTLETKPRQRKENVTKSGLIAELYKFLVENDKFAIENAEITNKERQIAFNVGENAFEITLIQKRKPKK